MKWVTTRPPQDRPDRLSWLIRRFIGPDAEIIYVAARARTGHRSRARGRSFDAPAPNSQTERQCTFESSSMEYHLGDDPVLVRLARIVHAADISEDLHN